MAITRIISNKFKFEKGKGNVDFSTDTFKVILMKSGFTFDKDTHGTYSDVSSNEITNAGGYTIGGYILSVNSAWAQDNTNDMSTISWADKVFTASGADYDDHVAAIIYDDTHANDLIVGCIDYGMTVSIADGHSFTLKDLGFDAV